jgi:hypothetical protein
VSSRKLRICSDGASSSTGGCVISDVGAPLPAELLGVEGERLVLVGLSRGTKFGVRKSSGKKTSPAELVAAALRVFSAMLVDPAHLVPHG